MDMDDKNGRLYLKVLCLLASFVIALRGFSDMGEMRRLKAIGKTAIVMPIELTRHTARGSTSHSGEVRFSSDAGRQVATTRTIPEEVVKDVLANKPVKVLYDPANPAEFVFETQKSPWPYALGAVALGAIALLLL